MQRGVSRILHFNLTAWMPLWLRWTLRFAGVALLVALLFTGSTVMLVFLLIGAPAFLSDLWASIESVRSRAKSRLLSRNICPRCYHDLRGTVGDRCGECGYWLVFPRSRPAVSNGKS